MIIVSNKYFNQTRIQQMSIVIPSLSIGATVLSIYSLAICLPICFIFKQHYRAIDYTQFFLLLSLDWAYSAATFSTGLTVSWIKFSQNFLSFCISGDFVCTAGFPLSFAICFVGVVLLLAIIFSFEKCRNPKVKFQPIYNFFKGLIKWFYLPLTYYSALFLYNELIAGSYTTNNFLGSVVVFAILLLFPFFQLMFYKCAQEQDTNPWLKWVQFFSFMRSFTFPILILVGRLVSPLAYHFIWGALVIYAVLYAILGDFQFKVMERIIFVFGECVLITIYAIFIYANSYIDTYLLDFFALVLVFTLDFILFIPKIVTFFSERKDSSQVNPANDNQYQPNKQDKKVIPNNYSHENLKENYQYPKKKVNKYDDLPQESYDPNSAYKSPQRKKR